MLNWKETLWVEGHKAKLDGSPFCLYRQLMWMEYKQHRHGNNQLRLCSSDLLLYEASGTMAAKNGSAGTKIINPEVGAALWALFSINPLQF